VFFCLVQHGCRDKAEQQASMHAPKTPPRVIKIDHGSRRGRSKHVGNRRIATKAPGFNTHGIVSHG